MIEPGLDELMASGVAAGRIRASTDAYEAIAGSDVSLICVGTPSNENGSLNLTHVQKVCHEIGLSLAEKGTFHVVVVRSTMTPGSTEDVVIPALQDASGLRVGADLGVCFHPEFLREGTSIADFYDPPFTVIGSESDDRAASAVRDLYAGFALEPVVVPIRVAEMLKYACNAFHALKVAFTNEMGTICRQQGIDSHQVMDLFCRDTKLNVSPSYLKPGFAFGGSCLPKDLRALVHHARRHDVDAPVLEAILPSNARQVERAFQLVLRTGRRRVGVLGLSFKEGTDDLRESPLVELIERLIGKGIEVGIHDPRVSLSALQGANREYIEREIPHIASLMKDSAEELIDAADVIVIGHRAAGSPATLARLEERHVIVDLAGIAERHVVLDLTGDKPRAEALGERYAGITW